MTDDSYPMFPVVAGPLYQGISVDKRLDIGDASFVDIVHSNQGQDGYFGNTGKADWYPNGGFFVCFIKT